MSADYENLRAFVLASTKMHLSNRHATAVLRRKIDFLSDLVEVDTSTLPDGAKESLENARTFIEDAFTDMDAKTEDLLNALEKFANG